MRLSGGAALPLDSLDSVLLEPEKLVRVMYWSEYRQLIRPDHLVCAHVVRPGPALAGVATIIREGRRIEVPPGVFVGVTKDAASTAGLLVIDLSGKFRLFGSVEPVEWYAGQGGDTA